MNGEANKALMTCVLPLPDPESSPVTAPCPDLLVHSGQQRLPRTAPRQGLCDRPLWALTAVLGQGHMLSRKSPSPSFYHLNLKLGKSLFRLFHNQTGAQDKNDDWLTEGYWGRETRTLMKKITVWSRVSGAASGTRGHERSQHCRGLATLRRLRGPSGLCLCG